LRDAVLLLLYVQYHITSLAETSRDSADNSRFSSASVRIHSLKPHRDGATLFPKLDECAHFHYEVVELQQIEVCQFMVIIAYL